MTDLRLIVNDTRDWLNWEADETLPGHLPYGIDALREHGIEPLQVRGRPTPKPIAAAEYRLGWPVYEPWRLARAAKDADVILTMFEDPAIMLAALQRRGRLPTPFVVMTCWLAERALIYPHRFLVAYRRAMAEAAAVTVFSENQRSILINRLNIPSGRIHTIDFGTDREFYQQQAPSDGEYVLVAGSDSGRDYWTLAKAASRLSVPIKLVALDINVSGIDFPPNVEYLGQVDHVRYRDLIARARLVALPVHPFAYPSGQSVLVEAMMCGKPVVVTDTAALRPYTPDSSAVRVPHADPVALADAIALVWDDELLRKSLAVEARRLAEARFDARQMWAHVAQILQTVTAA